MTTLEQSHKNKNNKNRKPLVSQENKQVGEKEDSGAPPPPKKEPKDMSKEKCYNCSKKGHISVNRSEKVKGSTNNEASVKATWKDTDKEDFEAAMYCTMCNTKLQLIREVVDKAVNTTIKLERWKLLLDKQVDVSII